MYIYVCVGRAGNERDRNKVSHGAAHDPYRIANYTFNPVLWTTLYAAAAVKKTLARAALCAKLIRGMELAKRKLIPACTCTGLINVDEKLDFVRDPNCIVTSTLSSWRFSPVYSLCL